jgi:hypothetical protein
MAEEASNAAKAVPYGILGSIGMCWSIGFFIVIVLAACMDPTIENVLGTPFGQPVWIASHDDDVYWLLKRPPRWRRSTTMRSASKARLALCPLFSSANISWDCLSLSPQGNVHG